ncbi:protein RNA-directed DNA methylation 3 isoform X2 [Tripterygium wilfordii]|uniref:protein RNA-directed DNA methylation 3 isoform X2 n=1 Tax=Tripterygium wilfordii TaxID=458696 RepID=UPI0018F86171|nr:protein RNA-directed DNA methylation 3 isoform X2 [Tripterygium wilfordii]
MSYKGKEIAGKPPAGGKRKRGGGDSDKWGGRSKKDRGVLRFFEDDVEVDDYEDSDDSDIDNFFLEEELDLEQKVNNEPGKSYVLPFLPKEEQLEEEFDEKLEEHYRDGSGLVSYAGENYESKRSFGGNSLVPCAKDPTIWKVKCTVGRERHSAFCLMQKFVDLKSLGTKLQIVSAFSIEHIKGFIYIEADKHGDIVEACKGLCGIYATRVAPVALNEVSHLLSVRSRSTEISEGMWARVKNGKYKGDLAQVVAVNNERKRATVKLIPRVDLQAMAQKFGGGLAVKRGVTPAPRLISSSELEEFRPLIQYRRDRDTGKHFEILDGLMLKDGYLYKRVSIDSLSFWGVMASEEELLKFRNPENNESQDMEWLTQLYGDRKRKKILGSDKGLEKGEGSSGADVVDDSELHSLVCFGRKEFGLIIGKEKDDHYKILTEGKEGPVVVPVEQRMIKKGPSDMKFTALDQHAKAISVGDKVRVLEGPLKDREGIVKQIYRGTIFMQDETETENGGYICARSQICEKVKFSFDASKEKGCESGNLGVEDFSSSPKSSLSPKKPWQERESNPNFNQGDKDGMFSIGQTVRIRIGPLKGYLCRVLAMRRSDVTVKLDSQQKILTVKCENLSEIRGKTSAFSLSEDAGSSSFKPFDQLGTEGSSGDWMGGAGTSAGGDGWNAGGQSTERSPWPSFPATGLQKSLETDSANPSVSANNDPEKEVDDTSWGKKVTQNLNSPWGATVANDKAVANEAGAWGTTARVGSGSGSSDGWDKVTVSVGGISGSSKDAVDKWDQSYLKTENSGAGVASSWGKGATGNDSASKISEEPWGKGKTVAGNPTDSWNGAPTGKTGHDSWSNSKDMVEAGSWGKNNSPSMAEDSSKKEVSGWGQPKSWDKGKDVVKGDESIWGKPADTQKEIEGGILENPSGKAVSTGTWGNAAGTWGQPEAKATDEASGWGKAENWGDKKNSNEDVGWTNNASNDRNHSDKWSKPKSAVVDGGSSWSKQGDESSWSKRDGGSSWGSQAAVNTGDESKKGDWTSSGGAQQESGWSKKSSWNAGSGGANEESGWAKKSSWNNDSGDAGQDSVLGRFEGQSDASGDRPGGGRWGGGFAGRDGSDRGGFRGRGDSGGFRGRGDRGGFRGRGGGFRGSDSGGFRGRGDTGGYRGRGGSGRGGEGSSWSKQDGGPSWGRQPENKEGESGGVNQESGWAKKSSWNNESGDTDQDRIDGQSEAFGDRPRGGRWGGGFRGSDRGGFRGRGDTEGYRGRGGSGRGGEGSWSKQDGGSSWGRQPENKEGESGPVNQDSGWAKNSSWNSGSGGANVESGWAKNSSWNSGSGDANQESGWAKKSSWNNESGDAGQDSVLGRSESQSGAFGDRPGGGSWGGGFGGRGGSDRGGFRGQGDRGGYRGRGSSGRGGYGGQGRFDGGGNDGNQGGDDKGTWKSWNSGSGGADNRGGGWNSNDSEWKKPARPSITNDHTGGWNKGTGSVNEAGGNEGGGLSGQQKRWNSGNSESSNEAGGWNKQGSGWNGGKCPENSGRAEDQSKIWNQSSSAGQASGWSRPKEAKEGSSGDGQAPDSSSKPATSSWGGNTSNEAGGWNKQGSGWNGGKGPENIGRAEDQSKVWNQSSSVGQASGWNQPKEAKEGSSGDGQAPDSASKPATSSWGGKGGW